MEIFDLKPVFLQTSLPYNSFCKENKVTDKNFYLFSNKQIKIFDDLFVSSLHLFRKRIVL